MSRDPRDPFFEALESLVCLLVALVVILAFAPRAHADVVSEFGMGVKLATTSIVLQPRCHAVSSIEFDPPYAEPWTYNVNPASCGGDNPTFIGWPIAWEREYRDGALRFRGGWFHYSNWFDGGRDRETHMDCACATLTVNWSQVKRNRRSN